MLHKKGKTRGGTLIDLIVNIQYRGRLITDGDNTSSKQISDVASDYWVILILKAAVRPRMTQLNVISP